MRNLFMQSHRKGAKNAKDMRKLGVLAVKKSFWFAYQHLTGEPPNQQGKYG
jgi:hypothetical protein